MKSKLFTAESIYYKAYKPHPAIVDGLIPGGLTILAGPPKIGKSWMALDLAVSVSSGTSFLGKQTHKTGVYYYCLEDTEERIRDRLHLLTDEPPDNLYFSTSTDKLGSGFTRDLVNVLRDHRDIELIIIDTLQKIRSGDDSNGSGIYGKDYEELAKIKEIADVNRKSIVVIHHLRKMKDRYDPFNEISGSTGISGASDTNMILRKPEGSNTAELLVRGRDIEERKLILEYDFPRWKVIEDKSSADIAKEKVPAALYRIAEFVRDIGSWSGNATQLLDMIDDQSIAPNKLMQQITRHYYDVFHPSGITVDHKVENKMRRITLTYNHSLDRCHAGVSDGSDSSDDTVPYSISPSLSSQASPVQRPQVLPP